MPRSFRLLVLMPLFCLSACNDSESERSAASLPAMRPVPLHPVFLTPVSGVVSARPAVQVDILDASEHWLLTAELYLTVQSSRFPSETWVMLPLNVGDFEGCRSRFVQLPFEVREGDTLLFNLLDDDQLTVEQEKQLLKGCAAMGYCLLTAGKVYGATAALVAPAVEAAADILGVALLDDLKLHGFKNVGTSEFHVPPSLPSRAGEANVLSLLDDRHFARVLVKLFAPPQEIQFSAEPPSL
ncbi:MAG TPA: hypothetical protein VM165_13200 [Planctomycetaceae bacterium]|nr:hypothetical protein [Planctomycetaceae bacterium]